VLINSSEMFITLQGVWKTTNSEHSTKQFNSTLPNVHASTYLQ